MIITQIKNRLLGIGKIEFVWTPHGKVLTATTPTGEFEVFEYMYLREAALRDARYWLAERGVTKIDETQANEV